MALILALQPQLSLLRSTSRHSFEQDTHQAPFGSPVRFEAALPFGIELPLKILIQQESSACAAFACIVC
ncbi:MAG: hypothetical protein AAFW84_28245, partial [Cyanobacteria bacterium J06635_15]